ncbi:MAG: hypothetical protein [Microvirus sp.]|nr:MAG: hypothetical protein [Microvirus sp.]
MNYNLTQTLAAIAKIEREKKMVASAAISEPLKVRMTADLNAELAKLEQAMPPPDSGSGLAKEAPAGLKKVAP